MEKCVFSSRNWRRRNLAGILDKQTRICYNRNGETNAEIASDFVKSASLFEGRERRRRERTGSLYMNGSIRKNEPIRKEEERSAYLLGTDGILRLRRSHVAVFGIGGVGSYATEALARAGVGHLTLVDHDTVSESNINRQLVALHSTVGRYKTDVARDRIADINSLCEVTVRHDFYLPENADGFDLSVYDYVIDAVDTVAAKLELVVRSSHAGTPIISCMGAGNKLDPTRFCVTDIFETSGDPLARRMRAQLRKCGVPALKVVCSTEPPTPLHPSLSESETDRKGGGRAPGSLSFVPSVAGLIAAGEVIRAIAGGENGLSVPL